MRPRSLVGGRGYRALIALAVTALFGTAATRADSETVQLASEVRVDEGRLSVDLRDAPLSKVLRAIGEQAKISVSGDQEPLPRLTMSFTDLPLEEGIKRLLKGVSHVLVYATEERGTAASTLRLVEIRLAGEHGGPQREASPSPASAAAPASPADWAAQAVQGPDQAGRLQAIRMLGRQQDAKAAATLVDLLSHDSDPVVRERAGVALAQIGGVIAAAALRAALAHPEPKVRVRALHEFTRLEEEHAAGALASVLDGDPDPWVRRQAVQALARLRGKQPRQVLENAASSPDPVVRDEATKVLGRRSNIE